MKPHNALGTALLAVAFVVDVTAAQSTGGVAVPVLGTVPQWAVYLGLFAICPQDLNQAIRNRIGVGGEADGG